MLTAKQKKLLDFINSYFKENSIYPTYEEMKNALHIKSKSSIHKLISSIEERGFIERIPHKARAIQFKDNREKKNLTKIPFLGKIAAGNPIEAITSSFEQVSVPDYLVNNTYEHFTLEVVGDSMKDEGILNESSFIVPSGSEAVIVKIVPVLFPSEFMPIFSSKLNMLPEVNSGGVSFRLEILIVISCVDVFALSLIVNVADLLSRWTDGAYKSTPHRVVNSSGKKRLSIVLAFDPNPETVIDAKDVFGNQHVSKETATTCGEYLTWRFEKAFAYRKKSK